MKHVLILSASLRKGGNPDLFCDPFAKAASVVGHELEDVCKAGKKA